MDWFTQLFMGWFTQLIVMDWLEQIFVFGLLALLFFILSGACAWKKKPGAGLVFAALELLSAVMATVPWMYALKISGKVDWFLVGIWGYPLVGLIFISMFVVGTLCAGVNFRGVIKRLDEKESASQA